MTTPRAAKEQEEYMKFPKTLYVTLQEPESGDPYFSADTKLFDATDPDGDETLVGVYTLTGTKKLRRVVQEMT